MPQPLFGTRLRAHRSCSASPKTSSGGVETAPQPQETHRRVLGLHGEAELEEISGKSHLKQGADRELVGEEIVPTGTKRPTAQIDSRKDARAEPTAACRVAPLMPAVSGPKRTRGAWKQRSRSGHFSSDHQWSWPKSPPPPVPTGERTASVLPRDLPASVSESASRGSGERSALP